MTKSPPVLDDGWRVLAAEPASHWIDMFPLGDGTLGAMCDGGPSTARFFLNHELGWSGNESSERPADRAVARKALEAAREALARDDAVEATKQVKLLQADYTQAFQPVGVVEIDEAVVPPVANYRRMLDVARGVHEVLDNDVVRSLTLIEHGTLIHLLPAGAVADVRVLPAHPEAKRDERPGERVVCFHFPSDAPPPHEPLAGGPVWAEGGMPAVVVTRWGKRPDGNGYAVVSVEVGFTPGAEPPSFAELTDVACARLDLVESSLEQIVATHEQDHQRAMTRAGLDLVRPLDSAARQSEGGDPTLAALAFNYGRYLLYSCCRTGSLPPTLQGLWSVDVQPPWSSNYTTNINLEMAHWPVGVAHVPEAVEPLVDLLTRVAQRGRDTAWALYQLPGWVCHHNTDAWAHTNPVGCGRGDPSWAQWLFGGAWLAFELVDFVRFGLTDDDLNQRIWTLVRGACEFSLGWVRRQDGGWVTSPATSPENLYVDASGRQLALDVVTASDLAISWQLASSTVWLADHLGVEDDRVVQAALDLLSELPDAPEIASTGELCEWSRERPPAEPQHRHLSHLIGLYPGQQRWDQAHLEAAVRTLDLRGDEGTSWSLAWKLCLWARLRRPDKVSDLLTLALRPCQVDGVVVRSGLYPNLLSAHPPFQLDGNLGLVAGIAEALVQSHHGAIDLLPALPDDWPSGHVWGLGARPGVRVDIEWEDGQLVAASFMAPRGARVACRYQQRTVPLELSPGVAVELRAADFRA